MPTVARQTKEEITAGFRNRGTHVGCHRGRRAAPQCRRNRRSTISKAWCAPSTWWPCWRNGKNSRNLNPPRSKTMSPTIEDVIERLSRIEQALNAIVRQKTVAEDGQGVVHDGRSCGDSRQGRVHREGALPAWPRAGFQAPLWPRCFPRVDHLARGTAARQERGSLTRSIQVPSRPVNTGTRRGVSIK